MNSPDARARAVAEVFDRDIRPGLAAHLGDGHVDHIDDDGVVHVVFEGACSHCSYRKNTLLGAIYPRLRDIDGVAGVSSPGVYVTRAEEQRVALVLDRYE